MIDSGPPLTFSTSNKSEPGSSFPTHDYLARISSSAPANSFPNSNSLSFSPLLPHCDFIPPSCPPNPPSDCFKPPETLSAAPLCHHGRLRTLSSPQYLCRPAAFCYRLRPQLVTNNTTTKVKRTRPRYSRWRYRPCTCNSPRQHLRHTCNSPPSIQSLPVAPGLVPRYCSISDVQLTPCLL